MSTHYYYWDAYYDNCICKKLKRVSPGTSIRVYYAGGQIDFTFKRIKRGCIKGEINNLPIYIDCEKVIGFYVFPKIEWIILEPGASHPLPSEPSEVNKISFEAKTDVGTTSVIELLFGGAPTHSNTVISIPTCITWLLSPPLPSLLMELKNTGSSTIYIRNLTTE